MSTKIKILQVTSGFRKGVSGGIPSVINNYCTSDVWNEEIQFDYLSLGYQTFEPYRKKLEQNHGSLYCLDIHSQGVKQLADIYIRLKKFLKNHSYNIVHINSGALTQVLTCCKAVKDSGNILVVAHSHNAISKTGLKGQIYNILKPLFNKYADAWFACSQMAAESMFPKNILCERKWILIPNAIEMKRFAYNSEIRKQYREAFGISNKYVIGHVGRFNEQKNHCFLIDVFSEIVKKREDAILLLIGEGALKDDIQEFVNKKGLSEKVIFTGQRTDVEKIMQAMDIFAFPSLYEGLGMVLIEAQVSGLDVIASDILPIETCISNNIKYVELNSKYWVKYLSEKKLDKDRMTCSSETIASGQIYDLTIATNFLKQTYFQLVQKID